MSNPKVEAGTILIIRTDGTEQVVKRIGKQTLSRIEEAIHAKCLDFVRIGKDDHSDLIMAVDDAGWETEEIDHGNGYHELRPIKARKPIKPQGHGAIPHNLFTRHHTPDRGRRSNLSR